MVAAPQNLEHAAAITATPLGAITIHKWARRSGRSPEFTIWKDDVDFYCKMMNVDNIETYLNLEEPHLADDGVLRYPLLAKGNMPKQSYHSDCETPRCSR